MTKKKDFTPEEKLAAALVPVEEQPYEGPENWCWTYIFAINNYDSNTIDPSIHPESTFELYSVPSSADNYPEILRGDEIGSSKQIVAKGDVLLCKINPRINRVWIVSKHTGHPLLASSEWIVVRNTNLNSLFLMYWFRSTVFRDYMLSNVSGVGGSLMRAQPKYVKNYPIPLPPLPEQQRIVERIESLFSKLDEAKALAQAVVDGFEDRKAAILHKAFTGELTKEWRESSDHQSFRQIVMIKNVCSSLKYGTASKSIPNGKIAVIRMGNLQGGEIDWTNLVYSDNEEDNQKYRLSAGDVLFNRTNSAEHVGKTSIYRGEHPAIYAGYLIKLDYDHSIIIGDYLNYLLNSPEAKEYCNSVKSDAVNQSNINAQKIGAFEIPLIGMDEQEKMVRLIQSINEQDIRAKESAESVLDQIDTMKKSILTRAFRGELGTNNREDESAVEMLKRVLEA